MGKMTIWQMLLQLIEGMGTSVQIFAVTLVFSLPLGLVVAFGRMSKNKLLQFLVKGYISVMLGKPLKLKLMVYISYAGNASDAAADGGLFRPLLFI